MTTRKCHNHTQQTNLWHARIQEFRQGGGGVHVSLTKKALTTFFLSLFYRSQKVNFKESYHFFKVPEGVQHFPGGGGVQLFPGGRGSNCLFPIETHITCDFPGGGGVRTPCPPLWIRTCMALRGRVNDNDENNKSSLFHSEMIAKLERTQSTAKQNKDLTLTPLQTTGATTMNKQQQNHRPRTDSSRSHRGDLINFTDQIFTLASAAAKTQFNLV